MLLLGIDVGTTGIKAILFDEKCNIIGSGFEETNIIYSKNGYAEQDANQIWIITKNVIKKATQGFGKEIKALSISVQGDAIIPIDKNRNPLAYAQLGMDYRGVEESKYMSNLFGDKEIFNKTGMRPHPLNSLIKILWIKNNNQTLYNRTYKFVTYSDFLLGKFGSDEVVIDMSMASRTMAMDIETSNWSKDILGKLEIDIDKFSKIVHSGEVVGKIDKNLANELNISNDILIVSGGHDQPVAALGSGIVKENMALDSHGTAEVISTAFFKPKLDDIMFNSYYPCYAHVVKDMYFTFSLNHTGGVLLKWFVEEFCQNDLLDSKKLDKDIYSLIINKIPDNPSDIMFLPHLNGSGAPTCDLRSKGAILGMTMATNKYDIAKAIIEALSYELKINMETMKKTNIDIKEIRCVGGGAKSSVVLQNKADILGIPVATLKMREAACLGAGVLAGVGAKIYTNTNIVTDIVKVDKVYEPRSDINDIYKKKYCIYSDIYDTIKGIQYRL